MVLNFTKKELRAHFIKTRNLLKEAEVKQKSKLIFEKIENLSEIFNENSFALYIPFKNEVDTRVLIDKLVSQKKAVYLPKFFEKEKAYFFVKFSAWKDLEEGYYGILQPKNNKKANMQNIDVLFVPGVAFDKKGVRLGWGMGIYDRLLRDSRTLKIGLAYDFQIADSLPRDEHDIKVDLIVTEKKIIRT